MRASQGQPSRDRRGPWRDLAVLTPLLGARRRSVTAVALLTLGGALLQAPRPLLTMAIVDRLSGKGTLSLALLFGALGTLLLAQSLVSIASSNLLFRLRERVVLDLQTILVRHIQRLPLPTLRRLPSGHLLSRVTGDARGAEGVLGDQTLRALESSLLGVAGAAGALWIHPRLALLGALLMPLSALTLRTAQRRVRTLAALVQEGRARVTQCLTEGLGGTVVLKTLGREGHEVVRFVTVAREALTPLLRAFWTASLAGAGAGLLSVTAPVALLWYGSRLVLSGEMTVGGLLGSLYALSFLLAPLGAFSGLVLQGQQALVALGRVREILSLPVEGRPLAPAALRREADLPEGPLALRRVSFRYDGRRRALTRISCEIPSGRITAIVGPSGAGKSTLLALLPRLEEPEEGTVLVAGRDARTLDLRLLRRRIVLLPQEAFLFSGTIEENLRLGDPGASRLEIERALERAAARGFVEALPRGLETRVGERGAALSAGERQRLALARALLARPRVLLLDEATSQVDGPMEEAVRAHLAVLRGETTIVMVSHRLATVREADLILILARGRLRASGIHRDLLRTSHLYRNLFRRELTSAPPEGHIAAPGEISGCQPQQPALAAGERRDGL